MLLQTKNNYLLFEVKINFNPNSFLTDLQAYVHGDQAVSYNTKISFQRVYETDVAMYYIYLFTSILRLLEFLSI